MRFKLETFLSTLGAITAVAYLLGWLKAYYYFDSFGIGLESVEMSPQDYLFSSWFVVENIVFFLLLVWVVASAPRWWSGAIAVVYFLIPIAAHYAFLRSDVSGLRFIIEYRHTLLKFIPFAVLVLTMLEDRLRHRSRLTQMADLSWPYGKAGFLLLVIVIAAWGISVAKHFGSFDANAELCEPDRFLPKVRLHVAADGDAALRALGSLDTLYLVHTTPARLFLWDAAGFEFGKPDQKVRIHVIPREKVGWVETIKNFQIQRGGIFL